MKTIVLANRKGGVGKSTLSYNLGAAYALEGKKVCFVDLDSQANLSMLCRIKPCTLDEFKSCRFSSMSPAVSILPATKSFTMLENEINARIDRNTYLKEEILPHLSGYDYVIIDTPPSLSILNINAFMVADMVHVIVNADAFSLAGLVEMRDILAKVRSINTKLDWRIVLNGAHKGRNITAAALNALRKEPGFSGIEVPNRQHFVDSNAQNKPAIDQQELRDVFKAMAALA